MSENFVGEIRMVGFNFAPAGWAKCDGQVLSISQNDVLYALLGTTYGGDGESTFALPDFRGRVPVHFGQNPSTGTTYTLGEKGGVETVTLTQQQIPPHNHELRAFNQTGTQESPANNVWASSTLNNYSTGTPDKTMRSGLISSEGGSQPHDNMAPFQAINFVIALYGIYPSQN